MRQLTRIADDRHRQQDRSLPASSAQRNSCSRLARPGGYAPGPEPRSRTCTDHPGDSSAQTSAPATSRKSS
jgi:hypothetical protein